MEPLLIFENFGFDNLDRSWIKQVWESSFTNVENVPTDYQIFLESQDIIELTKETSDVVKNWISQNTNLGASTTNSEMSEASTEVSWQTLIALNLDVRALLAVLAYLMKRGQAFDSGQESRRSCLAAAGFYFVLMSVPGSNAFQTFHPSLYELALKSLTLSRRLTPIDDKSKRTLRFDDADNDSADEDDTEAHPELSKTQRATLTKGLNGVLYDLVTMLNSAVTCLGLRSLEITVFHLVEMTKLSVEAISDFSRSKNANTEASHSSLAYNAWVALRLICNPKYATVPIITRIIGKYLLPQLSIANNGQSPNKQTAVVRDSTIHFFKTLLLKHESDAQEVLITLVQHLMINPPDRLEGRQKQAVVVIKLINLSRYGDSIYERCLRDLIKFSHHNKITCRIFAQEIIGKFLLDLSSSQNNRRDNDDERWSRTRSKELLLAAVLSRCVDASSMVRGRAIATLAEYTDSTDDSEVMKIFEITTKRQSTHMPNLEDLLDAVDNENVKNHLPNVDTIIKMLMKRSKDERALVRKSSVQTLRNAIIINPTFLSQATPIICLHCRDAALTVRRYAIRTITNLLEKFPENSSLCKDWVDSVIPRVFDGETKVQEEVLDSLQKLTIDKIIQSESHDDEMTNIDDLPWKILNELAKNKMIDHLSKACGIWVNCGAITKITIDKIKSHVDTKNNVGAWLLLGSMAEHRSLGTMTNYYDCYVSALTTTSINDHGFSSITIIRVLQNCWQSFDDQNLRKIHDVIIDNLRRYKIPVYLVSQCLDIVRGIEKFRAMEMPSGSKDEASTMRQLVRQSEETIIRIVEPNDDDERSNDEDSGTKLFRATCTLGHASMLCTEKISIATLRILQGFLLERDTMPINARGKIRELQGAAITVLGQQALRDREVAQEMTPIFGRLLGNARSKVDANLADGPAVRINAAKALADICVRFTALVEPYLPDMCVSMKDSNPDVRQIILVIIIQLLAEDFIKINGPFFFHILSMLSDKDLTIRRMTVFLVKERLLSKNKSLITKQFVNCLYHMNDYERREFYVRRRIGKGRVIEALTMSGDKYLPKRRTVYDFMLEHLDAPGKLNVLVNLTNQIFKCKCTEKGPRAFGQLDVNCAKGVSVFRDMIYVLTNDCLQPNCCAKQIADDDNSDDFGNSAIAGTTAANNLIVEAMRKHRIRVLLPGLVELKKRLVGVKSNLVCDVARFIHKLMNDHNKDQLEHIFNEYPDLDKEIERDIRNGDETNEVESNVDDNVETFCSNDVTKNSRTEETNLHVNPNWIPRIVLRRLSSLTYPQISGLQSARSPSRCGTESASRTPKRHNEASTSGQSSGRNIFADSPKRRKNFGDKRHV